MGRRTAGEGGRRLTKDPSAPHRSQARGGTLHRGPYIRAGLPTAPPDVLFDEKRREDLLRAVGVRFVRLVNADLGRGWAPVESRMRRELVVPGPVERSFRAVPRALGRVRAAAAATG
ncbi:hypothetical protein GCM10027300_30480 [Modestobacter lapidis]|nr:hypothetical protein [Modestobacter lapidis]